MEWSLVLDALESTDADSATWKRPVRNPASSPPTARRWQPATGPTYFGSPRVGCGQAGDLPKAQIPGYRSFPDGITARVAWRTLGAGEFHPRPRQRFHKRTHRWVSWGEKRIDRISRGDSKQRHDIDSSRAVAAVRGGCLGLSILPWREISGGLANAVVVMGAEMMKQLEEQPIPYFLHLKSIAMQEGKNGDPGHVRSRFSQHLPEAAPVRPWSGTKATRRLALPLYAAGQISSAFKGGCAAEFGRMDRFSHRVLQPATFAYCPMDHPMAEFDSFATASGTPGSAAS